MACHAPASCAKVGAMQNSKASVRQAFPLFLAGFVPLALTIVGIGAWYVHERKEITLGRYQTEAQHHVEGQVDRIRRFYRQGLLMVRGFSRDSAVLPALAGDADARVEMGRVFANIMHSLGEVDQLRLLDARGREVVRVERRGRRIVQVADSALQDKAHRDYVRRALRLHSGVVYVSPLDVNVEHGRIERPYRPMIRFAAIIGDGRGERAGLLVANFLGLRLMQPEMAETRLTGAHLFINAGSNWWFDRHGASLVALDDLHALAVAHRLGHAWRRLVAAGSGQLMTDDAMLTLESYRPDGVHQGDDVQAPVIQPRWTIASWMPLDKVWADVPLAQTMLIIAVLLAMAGLMLMMWSRQRIFRVQAEKQREGMLRTNQRLLRRLFRLREEEWARITRVIHDEIGQHLTAIQMRATAVGKLCSEKTKNYEAAREGVACISREAAVLTGILRHQIKSFMSPPIREIGLAAAVQGYCERWASDAGVQCEVQVDEAVDALPYEVLIQVYRIIQEGLTNIGRHAGASRVRLALKLDGGEFTLSIEDNGRGFDVTHETDGLGLAGMRERAQLLGGELHVDADEGGVCVVLRAPVPTPDTENPDAGQA